MKHKNHDKAVTILKDCEKRGLPIQSAVQFLMGKGMSYEQVLEAVNEAGGGALVETIMEEAKSKLAQAGIKVTAGKIAKADFERAKTVLAADDFDFKDPKNAKFLDDAAKNEIVTNLWPLEKELAKHIGLRPKLTGKIDSKGRMLVESEDLAGQAGVLSKAFKSLKLKTFNSSYSEDKGYWMTIHWSFVVAKGGSNGIDVLTAWYKDGQWTFGD